MGRGVSTLATSRSLSKLYFLAQKAAASIAMDMAPRTVMVVAPDVGVGALKTTSTWVTGGITVAVL